MTNPVLECVYPGMLKSAIAGGFDGGDFDDMLALQSEHQAAAWLARPTNLEMNSGAAIDSLRVTYTIPAAAATASNSMAPLSTQVLLRHGALYNSSQEPNEGTRKHDMELEDGLRVVKLSMTTADYANRQWLQGLDIDLLVLSTGDRRYLRAGSSRSHAPRKHDFFLEAGPGFCITHFHGRNGWYIDAVGAYFAAAVPRMWQPEQHHKYPADFKAAVQTLLLCECRAKQHKEQPEQRHKQQADFKDVVRTLLLCASQPNASMEADRVTPLLGNLPPDVMYHIIQHLNLLCYHTFLLVKDAGYTRPAAGQNVPVGFNMLIGGTGNPRAGRARGRRA